MAAHLRLRRLRGHLVAAVQPTVTPTAPPTAPTTTTKPPMATATAAASTAAAAAAAAEEAPGELALRLGNAVVRSSSGQLGSLRPSVASLPTELLRARLESDGYLYVPALIPADAVQAAYGEAREELQRAGLWPGGRFSAAWRAHSAVMRVAEAPELAGLCAALFGGGAEAASFPFKWLRTAQPGDGTGFHVDNVYMNRGSPNLLTAWLPLHDVPYALGGLCVMEASHRLLGLERFRDTYGQHDWSSVDNEVIGHSGIFTPNPHRMLSFDKRAKFLTTEYRAGDVLLLKMLTVHGAVANTTTDTTRLNIDCRWQPKGDLWDARYLTGGSEPFPGVPWDGGQTDTALIDDACLAAGAEREERRGRPGSLSLDEQKLAWGLPAG
jgi:hypothetical protein